MKIKAFRIPKQVVIPGLLVSVRQVRGSDSALDGADATWVYDDDKAIVNICRTLPLRRKRYLLWHELGHVLWDLMHDVRDNHKHVVDK
jgi:Zn-dependent peptidase ImmA (M78 family)